MELYHTSDVIVTSPDIIHSRDYLDFGKGFYLTSIYEQAERYGVRFVRRGREAWLSKYELQFKEEDWKILRFQSYDKNWLDFVAACRAGQDNTDYDIVIGGIANDKVIQTLDRFFEGEISKQVALGQLIFERPNIQYCIRSQSLIDNCLIYKGSVKL